MSKFKKSGTASSAHKMAKPNLNVRNSYIEENMESYNPQVSMTWGPGMEDDVQQYQQEVEVSQGIDLNKSKLQKSRYEHEESKQVE